MCWTIHAASDCPLPTWPWSELSRAFYVEELDPGNKAVRRQFSHPMVYYLGSHIGCGCGFQYGDHHADPTDDTAELAAARACWVDLVNFVAEAIRRQPEVELFACWNGDEGAEADHRSRITLDELRERTSFREKELLTVVAAGE